MVPVLASAVDERLGAHFAAGVRTDWHRSPGYPASVRLTGLAVLAGSVRSAVWLSQVPVHGLSQADRLTRVRVADRVAAWAGAQASAALADYVGEHTGSLESENDVRLEVRIARRQSDDASGADIATARVLAGVCAPLRDLWATGAVSVRHVNAVLDRTCRVPDTLTTTVLPDLLAVLPGLAANQVRRTVTRLLARRDPTAMATAAHHARRHDLGVRLHTLPDGLAEVVATLRVEDARAVLDVLDTHTDRFLTHRRTCPPCTDAVPDEIGPARAHAFLSYLLTHPDDALGDPAPGPTAGNPDAGLEGTARPGTATASAAHTRKGRGARTRRRGETQVVIDLATLLGLAENPGLLGGEPVPAEIARELAATTGTLRRIITDPLTGHLLDYGTRTYLPDPLREFVLARDATCTSPGCRQPAARSQLDHIVPFPHGPSDPTNTHTLCKRDHDTKTRGTLHTTTHHADGTATWRTRDGQHGTTGPRPYLNPPETPPF